MESFKSELEKKELSPTTIKTYLRNIEKLMNHFKAKNLNFLKDVELVDSFLKKYKPNTIRSYLISIVSVLGLDPKLVKTHKIYYDKMMSINKELKEFEKSGVKTDTQEKNWINEEELQKKEDSLKEKSKESYNDLLNYLVLSLYTKLPPRRNEYRNVLIVKNSKGISNDNNYLDLNAKQFIFNQFKTVKKEGQVKIDIPDNLMSIIQEYIKLRKLKPKDFPAPFLVDASGKVLNEINSITRILNKIFNKKIGSSMLRHLYLSNKYGKVKEEMKSDSEQMSHSTSTQADYIKS